MNKRVTDNSYHKHMPVKNDKDTEAMFFHLNMFKNKTPFETLDEPIFKAECN
jgi:hypothetical protein